ncbi:MAG: hypothetical protein QF472_07770 [Candidatus Marinimicrobia bacterium]|jgi:hypothetical protein|nr:hypothetical protein [Candidatus Neomarinimicrobiota bacterium]
MQKLLILTIAACGFVFAGQSEDGNAVANTKYNPYAFVEDTGQDDMDPEGRRRGGKGSRKRRRGGSGLR